MAGLLDFFERDDFDLHCLHDPPIGCGIGGQFDRIEALHYANSDAAIVQMPRDRQTISAVVAAAAKNRRVLSGDFGQHLHRNVSGRAGGVFHQDDAGDGVALNGELIDLKNLRACESNHG